MKRCMACLLVLVAAWFSFAAAQAPARKVTVTLVRWPYT